ncbi:hypothetical protein FQA39_LY16442 [Lamprigera yunnana]|nr:hypothetical protein FQA39_LY16442 [Lamprigera yunnana]
MQKIKPVIEDWIRGFPELKCENNKTFCRACMKTINCDKKYNIVQHTKTTIDQDHLKKFTAKAAKQQTISESIATTSTRDEQSEFCH